MRLTRDGKLIRTDIWREGKWLDLWSVVHFLSGISLGLGLSIFHFGVAATLVIGFLLLVAYEMWEAMVQIAETPQNRFMDVVVGMTSFVPACLLAPHVSISYFLLFALILAINIFFSTLGWLESQKAAVLEKRLQHRSRELRRRFLERRTRLRMMLPPEQGV